MTAPKKPARRPARAQPPIALDAPPLNLTPAELSLLKSFRGMDDEGREFIEKLALRQAARFPRRAAPSLRLVESAPQKLADGHQHPTPSQLLLLHLWV